MALRGFHAARAYSADPEASAELLEALEFEQARRRLGSARRRARRPLPLRRAAGGARDPGRRQRPPHRLGLDDRRARGVARAGDLRRRPADPGDRPLLLQIDLLPRAERRALRDRHAGAGLHGRRAARAPRREALAAARLRAPARRRSSRSCARSSTRVSAEPGAHPPSEPFVWRDAGRTIVFRDTGLRDAPELLAEHGFESFELLTTERAAGDAELLREAAAAVPPGRRRARFPTPPRRCSTCAGSSRLVALGGGRVIDTAKAIAAVTGAEVAAIPTTLSGAEMTGIHRIPAGAEDRVAGLVRPSLVIAEPEAMTGLPEPRLRASAMNALAHARRLALHALRQPRLADDRAARGGADRDRARRGARRPRPRRAGARRDPQRLRDRLGPVRASTTSSARPWSASAAARTRRPTPGSCRGRWRSWRRGRPAEIAALAAAIGTEPDRIEERILELGGNPPGLGAVGADRERLGEAVDAILERPELGFTPEPAEPRGADRADRARLVAGESRLVTARRPPCSPLGDPRASRALPRLHAPSRRQLAALPAGPDLHDAVLPRLLPLRRAPAASTAASGAA